MKKKILALTLSVAMLTTGALTSVPAAEFEDTSICATEVSSDAIEDFDSLDTREDTEVEFDNTDSNFSSEENIDYSYEGIDFQTQNLYLMRQKSLLKMLELMMI